MFRGTASLINLIVSMLATSRSITVQSNWWYKFVDFLVLVAFLDKYRCACVLAVGEPLLCFC